MLHNRKTFITFFFLLNLCLASFFVSKDYYPNATSRALPAYTLITEGSWEIDRYEKLTIDKSFVGGHFYTDKAPLSTIVTLIPSFLLLDLKRPSSNSEFYGHLDSVITLGGIFSSSLMFTLLMILTLLIVSRGEYSRMLDYAVPILFLFYGSNLFAYSGVLWGHLLAALLLTTSYYFLSFKNSYFLSGLLLGLGVCAEYPLGIVALIWSIQLLMKRGEDTFKRVMLWGSGLLGPAVLLMCYHYIFTGHPFKPLYFYVATDHFKRMSVDLGLSLPDLVVMYKLLFSQFRGALFYTPVIIFLFFSYFIKGERGRFKNSFVLTACTSLFLLNAGYFVWDGGWCHGPRHLLPALALLIFFVAVNFDKFHFRHWGFYVLSGFGVILNIMAKSVGTIYSSEYEFPYLDYIIPQFLNFKYSANNFLMEMPESFLVYLPFVWIVLFLGCIAVIIFAKRSYESSL
jgi:hypothetical protein